MEPVDWASIAGIAVARVNAGGSDTSTDVHFRPSSRSAVVNSCECEAGNLAPMLMFRAVYMRLEQDQRQR